MGIKHWGIGTLAAVLVCVMTGASATEAVPAKWAPTYSIDPATAYDLVAATPTGVAPEPTKDTWASCALPITIDFAAAPGVDPAAIRRELAYPIRYLQALGYQAGVGEEVPYTTGIPMPSKPGVILVIATVDRADQPGLASNTFRGFAEGAGPTGLNERGRISIMATNGLSSDVLLHEVGHILGLAHKDGTVMTVTDNGSLGFDAAETAAIDCR